MKLDKNNFVLHELNSNLYFFIYNMDAALRYSDNKV